MRERPPDDEQQENVSEPIAELEMVDAEDLLARRSSPRKRLIQAGVALLCVLVVFALFHSTSIALPTPSATATLSLPDTPSQVAILANVSYGSVTVNGKKLAGKPPFIYHASSGSDTVTFIAPPFAPHTCQVSETDNDGTTVQLTASGDGCSTGGGDFNIMSNGRTTTVANVLGFDFGPGDLPDNLKTSAYAFIQQLMTPVSLSTNVPTGQYYATGRDSHGMILSQVATTPLTARVSILLPVAGELTSRQFYCQDIICLGQSIGEDDPGVPALPAGKVWSIMVPLATTWQFLTADQQVVGSEHESEIPTPVSLFLLLDDSGNWQLAQPIALAQIETEQYTSSICNIGINELGNVLQLQQENTTPNLSSNNDHELLGCEIQIVENDGTVIGTVIWRFGVLLAADSKTHAAYPWLPLAPKAEVAAVIGG